MIRSFKSRNTALAAYAALMVVAVLAAYLSAQAAVTRGRTELEAVSVASAQQQREATLAGCERSRGDRLDAIKGWTAARQARLKTAHTRAVPLEERLVAAAAAARYLDVVDGYRSRIVDCSRAFPPVNTAAVRRFVQESSK